MKDLSRDLRQGLRRLAQHPSFTAVVIATLALGIGVNTAIFSLVNGLLLDLVPYEKPGRLMYLTESSKSFPMMSVSYPNFLDWKERNGTFEAMAAHRYEDYNLTGLERPEVLKALQTSASLFPLLRAEPALGRTFSAEEDQVGGPRVMVVSHGFWERRLGAADDAVGRILTLDGEPWEVIGVMPPEFKYPLFRTRVDLWMPIGHFAADWLQSRGDHPGIRVTARLAPETTEELAQVDLDRIAAELEEEYPDFNTGHRINVLTLREIIVRGYRPALIVLTAGVGLVLLIACVNVASLLLARGAARGHEMAVRGALGAGRWQLTRQLLTESVLLALAGGTAGLLVADLSLRALLSTIDAANLPVVSHIAIDGRVLVFALAVSVATGLLFGLAPVLQALRTNLVEALRDAVKGSGGADRRRLRSALVIGEMALALVLLVGAVLFARTFYELLTADPGFESRGIMTFQVELPPASYAEGTEQADFFDELVRRLETLPGAERAAVSLPLLGGWQSSMIADGQPPPAPGEQKSSEIYRASPGIFEVLGLKLIRGRLYDENDREETVEVAVIDTWYADTFWPGENPVGRRVKFDAGPDDPESSWIEVVGVVNHIHNEGVNKDSRMQIYLPFRQQPLPFATVAVRSSSDPRGLTALAEREVQAIDASQPVTDFRTLDEIMAGSMGAERVTASLLSVFAGLALLLAAIGVYGIMAHSVEQRRREIGIRMALGAGGAAVLGLVLRRGLLLVAAGIVLGLALALPVTSLIADQLWGVEPRDPGTLLGVPVLLASVGLLACVVPARRASRVEPVRALHHE